MTEVVELVRFGFMTDEEAKKLSVVKITNPNMLDELENPEPGGLYDPAMGRLDERSLCKSCGERALNCPGHCGHIELAYPVYNPLLFTMLSNILSKTCFQCLQFRSSRQEVENLVYQLELIHKGDMVEAKKLSVRQGLRNSKSLPWPVLDDKVDGEGSPHSTVHSDNECHYEDNKQACWDSYRLAEAMSALSDFFRMKTPKCPNCDFKNPKITRPTFGWFYVKGLPSHQIRADIIQGKGLDVTQSAGIEDMHSSEVQNTSDHSPWKEDSWTAEADSFVPDSNSTKKPSKKDGKRNKQLYQGLGSQPDHYSGPLLQKETRNILRQLWVNEAPLCKYINDIQQQQRNLSGNVPGYYMFFLETIIVPPMKFRPPAKANDSVMEHPQTVLLGKVLQSNIAVGNADSNGVERSKMINRLMDLQQSINVLFDSKTAASQTQKDGISGICQYLEKKEGLFRQKMMGKRVNFACRSVISPDPYLSANEIGIPPDFALKLTYPERVTPWNAGKLRNAVINGPGIHPGATKYVDSVGPFTIKDCKKMRLAISRKLPSSRGAQSGKDSELEYEGKIVYRHLQDGDIVLVNRQPTLHKPSIMAHVVRVLKGEKTLRMHYANCSSYNADFDGDEINVHFPQDEISRAEGYNIVNANEQYIVPTRGDTVRGLIQDHIVSAVLLTMKNTFLTRAEFSQLLYGSGVFAHGSGSLSGNHFLKVSLNDSGSLMDPVLPAVWKPEPLWTGKQVISALLNQITRGRAPCTVENQGKVPKNYFTGNNVTNGEEDKDQNAEHNFLVWKNELVRGVIDKAQFGKFGLVHTVQELYGSNSAGILLSALSRLFTLFLQIHGFTCGLDDLIILPRYDAQRKDKLEGEDVGEEVHCNFVKFKPGQIGPEELQLEIEKVICSDRESSTASLDMKMKNKLTNKLTEGSQILKHLLTAGLLKPFPKNCISVMTTTGAKGSTVNFQQISAYLGQQELEGKRVPRMVSGKTLPSFPPWDYQSRAGGFITDRFLTGLRPQEYYFHCMAGREGLVDTAVKTSRSGYLQRCLIKNLESLKVCYDCTVRDADGSIVQFYYGEDGVDVHQTSFLTNFKALEDNRETMSEKFQDKLQFNGYIEKLPEGLEEAAKLFIQDQRHKRRKGGKKEQRKFLDLVKQKYISSLAPSGEPVGIIAAQSVGEPSTQMTLNTFHLAGRGEMNVTLGIPRLQEILTTASETIKTPLLTCPLLEWRPKDEVVALASRAKKVTVADLVESMEVQLSFHYQKMYRVYKLIIKLKDTEFVPLEDVHDTLRSTFLRELEDAIESHVIVLSKISGIQSIKSKFTSGGSSSNEGDEEEALPKTKANVDDDDDDDDGDDNGDDLGSDVQKRKRQAADEVDYEDGSKGESSEEHVSDGDNSEAEEIEHTDGDKVKDNSEAEENEHNDVDNVKDMDEDMSDCKPSDKKCEPGSTIIEKPGKESRGKKTARAQRIEVRGLLFAINFRFTNEPHFLLCQLAQKTAKKVFIKRSGKISQCKMVEYDPGEKSVIWDDNKKPKRGEMNKRGEIETSYWAVKASGDDFRSFWEMYDEFDLSRLYSNNIHAVLKMYGVEAARATLIREVKNVFDIYGVKIDFRHLSLIADYMTHAGGYRPMSRHGGIAESVSPFLKMTFETASKFIVQAASHGLTDNLETPSSRLCLGLPVKMGTGSFDLMQKLDD